MVRGFSRNLARVPLDCPLRVKLGQIAVKGLCIGLLGLVAFQFNAANQPSWLQGLENFLVSQPLLVIFLVLGPFIADGFFALWKYVAQSQRAKALEAVAVRHMETLIGAIDIIVASKLQRYAETSFAGDYTHKDLLEAIANPASQIEEILIQFHGVMENLTGLTLKLIAVEYVDGEPQDKILYWPRNHPPPKQVATNKYSFCTCVIKAGKPLAISDIGRRIKRKSQDLPTYWVDPRSDPQGSIIGFPVFNEYTRQTVFVVTLKCNDENCLNKGTIKSYKPVWRRFSERLVLEQQLKQLLKHAHTD